MSIFQKVTSTIVKPAYDLVTLAKSSKGHINLKAGDRVQIGDKPSSEYIMYSVMSCALEDGDCPIEAYNRAIQYGHKVYFIVNAGSCISASSERSCRRIMLNHDDVVRFEGKLFNVLESDNHNLCLKEI